MKLKCRVDYIQAFGPTLNYPFTKGKEYEVTERTHNGFNAYDVICDDGRMLFVTKNAFEPEYTADPIDLCTIGDDDEKL